MAAIIVISVVAMICFAYMNWGSLDRLKEVNFALGTVLAVCAFAAWIISERVETLQGAKDNETSAKNESRMTNNETAVGAAVSLGGQAKEIAQTALNRPPTRGGRLLPGNENTDRFLSDKITSSDFVVLMGGIPFVTKSLPLNVIRQGDEVMLSISAATDGEGVDVKGKFFDENGEPICEIDKNRFTAYEHNLLDLIYPDPQTLTILGFDKTEVVKIRYLNKRFLVIDGDFYVRNGIRVRTLSGILEVETIWMFNFGAIRDGGSSGRGAALQIGPSNDPSGMMILNPPVLEKMRITPEILAQYPVAEAAVRDTKRKNAEEKKPTTHDSPPSAGKPAEE